MEPISELLDRVQQSEQARLVPLDDDDRFVGTVYYRWMVEATNRIQELEHRVEVLSARVSVVPL